MIPDKTVTVNVIGLGYIGLPTALMLAAHGVKVIGSDTNKALVETLCAGRITFEENGLSELFQKAVGAGIGFSVSYQKADVYIISVPTPYNKFTKKIDPGYVVGALKGVLSICPRGAVIVIESTISPGTIEKSLCPVIEALGFEKGRDIHIVHAPERIIPGNMIYELEHNNRTIGAEDRKTGEKIKALYASFCRGEIVVTDIKTAEMTKVVENTYRAVNIAFANELMKICRHDNMDVYEIIRICNLHPRVNILQPGPGVGGHCISVDPWFLVGDYPSLAKVIDESMKTNDSMPTYNFANVIDDHLMGITHVLRGNEYLSSTPKYNLLYEAFGWTPPVYIHCPPVMKDAHQKLSKRNGDASYQDLVAKGYLSEAVLNYLLLLGWSPEGEKEIFSLEEMIRDWDPARISKSPAIFDPLKLRHINFEYIKALSPEAFAEKAKPMIGEATLAKIKDLALLCKNLQPRTEVLGEIPEQIAFIDALPDYDTELFCNKKMKTDPATAKEALSILRPILEAAEPWTPDAIFAACAAKAAELEMKNGKLLYPLGIALAGTRSTPGGGTDLAVILGREETLSRIDTALGKLADA